MTPTRMDAIMSGEDRSISARLLRVLLSCAAPLYRLVISLRNAMFDCGLRKPVKLARPAISIGNITTGGTGKTPMVMELARRLLAMGEKPGILTRGYRGGVKQEGAEKTSDEVELFRAAFGDAVPVEVNANRALGAAAMLEKHADISVFLLDDGFQHRQVVRDLDIVLIDATQPFGHGRLLPRGLLREPVKNLARANAIMLTRCNEVDAHHVQSVNDQIAAVSQSNIVHAQQQWHDMVAVDRASVAISLLRDQSVFAFTGIGNPAAFEKMLRRYTDQVVAVRVFPDHHAFTATDVHSLISQATASGARAMVTTEKDWTKIDALLDWKAQAIPIYRPRLKIDFPSADEWNALEKKIKAILHGSESQR